MWIDRYFFSPYHPEAPNIEKLYVGFCPEGYYKVGDTIPAGEWTKTIVAVDTRYKKANEYIERKWAPLVSQKDK